MKKLAIMALILAMCLMGVASAATLNEVGTLPLSNETITFTVGVAQNANVEDWTTNAQTLKYQNDLNIALEFVEYPSKGSELVQKFELQVMAGGDELPDIMMSNLGGMANLVQYGQMGMIVPTSEYYQTIAYYTDQNCENNGLDKNELLRYVTCYDGEIYGLMRYHQFVNNSLSGDRMLVYEPWLETLGIEMPATTDEFVEMLRAFAEKDPNGNGEADEIPLLGYSGTVETNFMRFLMNPFIFTQENYYNLLDDGTVDFVANKDEWREGIRWIKSMMDEGLISPLTLTQDQTQMTAIVNEEPEKVGCMARISASNLSGNDPRRGAYTCVSPLAGPNGEKNHNFVTQLPSIQMVITKTCKDPEAAFRFGDYMCCEEMSIWQRYGEEGVDWVPASDTDVGTMEPLGYKPYMVCISPWGGVQNHWWAQVGPYILTDKVTAGQVAADPTTNTAYKMGLNMPSELEVAKTIVTGLIFNEEEQEVVTEFKSTINGYVSQAFSEFITGTRDIDADWDAYVAEFDAMGLEPYMAAVNSCYARMFAE